MYFHFVSSWSHTVANCSIFFKGYVNGKKRKLATLKRYRKGSAQAAAWVFPQSTACTLDYLEEQLYKQNSGSVSLTVQSATALLRSSTSTEALCTCVHRDVVCQLKKKHTLFYRGQLLGSSDFQLLAQDLISPLPTTVGIFLHPGLEAWSVPA